MSVLLKLTMMRDVAGFREAQTLRRYLQDMDASVRDSTEQPKSLHLNYGVGAGDRAISDLI